MEIFKNSVCQCIIQSQRKRGQKMQVDSIPPPPQTKAQVESNLAEAWAVVSRAACLACVDKLQSQYERALPLLDDVAKSI